MNALPQHRRDRVIRERQRIDLDDLIDAEFRDVLAQAAARLPSYSSDALFAATIRAIWRRNGDELPEDLEAVFRSFRTDSAWLEDSTPICGDLTDMGLKETARLVVSINARHRTLAGLRRGSR